MANFDSGVRGYVHAQAVVDVYFPIDAKGNEYACCEQCPYFRTGSSSCALNDKKCAFPSKYVGEWCPLNRVEE